MNNEDLVIVYWNDVVKGSIKFFGASNIKDMDEFAKKMVPEGTHYNIVPKKDVAHPALPLVTDQPVTIDYNVRNLFYEYLESL